MVRAAQLVSLLQRRNVAAELVALVALAEHRLPPTSYRRVRHRVVLEQRDSLLALAERLGQPAPLDVAVVAQLTLLLSDASSPAYVGGRHPSGLPEVVARCVRSTFADADTD
jgi:hypothetical protein